MKKSVYDHPTWPVALKEEEIKLTFWERVNFILSYPFWLMFDNRKPKAEFKNSMKKHEHDFTGETVYSSGYKFTRCRHFGCYMVNPED